MVQFFLAHPVEYSSACKVSVFDFTYFAPFHNESWLMQVVV